MTMFNLINKKKLLRKLNEMYNMMMPMEAIMRKKWADGHLTEWSFYNKTWKVRGRLSMIKDIIKMLG